MTIDFQELHIQSLHILAFLGCNPGQEEAITEKIRTYRKTWPKRPFGRLGLHEADGSARHVELSITRHARSSRRIHVSLEIHPVLNDKMPRSRQRQKQIAEFDEISDVLSHIASLDVRTRCHAHIKWEFDPAKHESIIKLPMLSTGGGKLPFDCISGVRFRRRSENGDMSIIVDANQGGELGVVAHIPLAGQISLGLVDELSHSASEIIGEFIFDVSTESDRGEMSE